MAQKIPEFQSILDGLTQLKLNQWKEDLEKSWENISSERRGWLTVELRQWIQSELNQRHSSTIQRRIHDAKFIQLQTVDQYDFHYNASTKKLEKDYLALHQKARQKQIPKAVFVGTTGLGKTHLARALGYAACQAGTSVLFTKASQIVNDLATAKSLHCLEKEIKKYRKSSLLIIDELGYVSMGAEEGNLFFQVISDRHDRGLGTIVTTNFTFGHWNQIFAAESTAVVVVERLTANGEVFYLEGDSYPQHQKNKRKSK